MAARSTKKSSSTKKTAARTSAAQSSRRAASLTAQPRRSATARRSSSSLSRQEAGRKGAEARWGHESATRRPSASRALQNGNRQSLISRNRSHEADLYDLSDLRLNGLSQRGRSNERNAIGRGNERRDERGATGRRNERQITERSSRLGSANNLRSARSNHLDLDQDQANHMRGRDSHGRFISSSNNRSASANTRRGRRDEREINAGSRRRPSTFESDRFGRDFDESDLYDRDDRYTIGYGYYSPEINAFEEDDLIYAIDDDEDDLDLNRLRSDRRRADERTSSSRRRSDERRSDERRSDRRR